MEIKRPADRRRNIHKGICASAWDMLMWNTQCPKVYELIRKVRAQRQREIVKLMFLCSNFSISFTTALLALTLKDDFQKRKHTVFGLSRSEVMMLKQDARPLMEAFVTTAESYQGDLTKFVLVTCYVRKMLSNQVVSEYLRRAHPEAFQELIEISLKCGPLRRATHTRHVDRMRPSEQTVT